MIGHMGYRHHVGVTAGQVAAPVREALTRYLGYTETAVMSLLGVDLGTSVCKAAVFDTDGRCLAQAWREYRTLQPHPGQAELDSREVWQRHAGGDCRGGGRTRQPPITALCVSSFGEAVVPVSRTRARFSAPAFLCRCPRRGIRAGAGRGHRPAGVLPHQPQPARSAVFAAQTALAARSSAGAVPARASIFCSGAIASAICSAAIR